MAPVATHPGGPFYVWYHDTYGYNPPATVDSNAARYLAWQRGVPRQLAQLIPYGAMGDPGQWIAGGAILQAPVIAAPAPPAPPSPPPAPKPVVLLPGVGAAGSAPLAPILATLPTGEQVPTTAGELLTEPTGTTAIPLPAGVAPVDYGVQATDATAQLGLSPDEIQNVNDVLNAGLRLHASRFALKVACCIGWGENHWVSTTCNGLGYCGVFQVGKGFQAEHDFTDTSYWATYAFEKGFYGYGGIIDMVAKYPNASAGRIANMCQGAYANLDQGAAYYDQYDSQADATINAFLPGLGTTVSSPGATPQPTTPTTGGIFDLMDSLNWAGDFINLWKYLQGGANEAANMASDFETSRINQITTIGWS